LSKLLRITRLLVISFDRKDSGLLAVSAESAICCLVLASERLSMKSLRKKPGSTTVAWIPSGASSSCRASVIPSTANLVEHWPPSSRSQETAERGEIYDVARLLPAHRWKHGPDDVQHGENIGAVDAFDVFARRLFTSPKHAEASVIDEDINSAEPA